MDSFEFNKIAGGILGSLLFLVALNIAAEAIFAPPKPAKPGYVIEIPKAADQTAKAAPEESFDKLLASATVERGESAAKVCTTCHTFDKGGPNKVGPNQWNLVGRKKASEAGFSYSSALQAKGGEWTYEDIDHMIFKPQAFIRGTKMAYAGMPKEQDRADVIAYLRTMNDNPPPLP